MKFMYLVMKLAKLAKCLFVCSFVLSLTLALGGCVDISHVNGRDGSFQSNAHYMFSTAEIVGTRS